MTDLYYNKTIDFYIDKIKNNEHFKYSRFNDGELICIDGKSSQQKNCDAHIYFPSLSNDLKNILLTYQYDKNYILQSYQYWHRYSSILKKLNQQNNQLTFQNEDFIRMSHENNPKKFIELLDTLKLTKLVIIGPYYLKKLKVFLNFKFIEVPLINCYLKKEEIIEKIKEHAVTDHIFLFSASMATNVIIDNFKDDKKNTYIDWGSVWDTFFVSKDYNFIKRRSTSNQKKYKKIYKNYLV